MIGFINLFCGMQNTITYGESPSQFLAIMALIQHAIDHGIEFPLALQIFLEESYVDDFPLGEIL